MQFDDSYLSILLILLVILVFALLILICLLLYFLFFSSNAIFKMNKQGKNHSIYFCKNHLDTHSEGACAICEDYFCNKCLKEYEKLNFCPEHFKLFLDTKWDKLDSAITCASTSETASYLHRFKSHLWKNDTVPTYIVTHYRINVENDLIESSISLYASTENFNNLALRLEAWKKSI